MKFQPKTEEEVQAAELCPAGKYPFTILECATVVSKSEKNAGKEMMKVKVNVHGDDNCDYHVYDYIAPWFMEYKFRHFFYCINRGADYESGEITPESYNQLQGWCDVGIQKAKGEFGPKNTIADYVVANAAKAENKTVKPAPAAPAGEADDVPF